MTLFIDIALLENPQYSASVFEPANAASVDRRAALVVVGG